jgi:hypothetical protein
MPASDGQTTIPHNVTEAVRPVEPREGNTY